ncbi:armadillo-type protein [Pyronema domesticum]|nr:armadillo-type protein [Pyronema domesticum]
MTRTEEETTSSVLLSQLNLKEQPSTILTALSTLKHSLIGHDETKEFLVQQGISTALVHILSVNVSGSCTNEQRQAIRLEASMVVGSLVYGGEYYIRNLLQSGILAPLISNLNPDTTPPKLIVSSLKTLNTMLDTYIPVTPFSPNTPHTSSVPCVAIIAEELYNENGDHLRNLYKILSQESMDRLVHDQVSLAAALIAKSLGRATKIYGKEEDVTQRGAYQKRLVAAGVLDALAARLGLFAPEQYVKRNNSRAGKLLPNARLAPLLDAISTIIRNSKLRSLMFMFSPALASIFPYVISDDHVNIHQGMALHLPQTKSEAHRPIITPKAFPPLSSFDSRPVPTINDDFPPLSPSHSSAFFPSFDLYAAHAHHHQHPSTTRRQSWLGTEGDDKYTEDKAEASEHAIEIAESGLINWIIGLVREADGDPLIRVSAAELLTSLFQVGLVAKRLISYIPLLIIPVLIKLIDNPPKNVSAFGGMTIGGVSALTWNQWQIEERAPFILVRLIMDRTDFKTSAYDAKGLTIFNRQLERVCKPPPNANTYSQVPSLAEYYHRQVRMEGILQALAHLVYDSEDRRKELVEMGILPTIVAHCLTPQSSPTDGNTIPVLIAACALARSIARSVANLRTDINDSKICLPVFELIKHPNDSVKAASCSCICNLVLEFSPMRQQLEEAGIFDILCKMTRHPSRKMRFEAVWALKHLMLLSPLANKKVIVDLVYLWNLAENPEPPAMEQDTMMLDQPDQDPDCVTRLPSPLWEAMRALHKAEKYEAEIVLHEEAIALQEQLLEMMRNILIGSPIGENVDAVFEVFGQERLFGLYVRVLSSDNTPPQVIKAVLYNLVHIAAGWTRHQDLLTAQVDIMNALVRLSQHNDGDVRAACVYVLINLTTTDADVVYDDAARMRRIDILKNYGWMERLKVMEHDSSMNVKERVRNVKESFGFA